MALDAVAPPPCSARRVDANAAPTQLPVLPIVPLALPHLPASRAEMEARGWNDVDVVFVTGDAIQGMIRSRRSEWWRTKI